MRQLYRVLLWLNSSREVRVTQWLYVPITYAVKKSRYIQKKQVPVLMDTKQIFTFTICTCVPMVLVCIYTVSGGQSYRQSYSVTQLATF
jgi:hypothetical protein